LTGLKQKQQNFVTLLYSNNAEMKQITLNIEESKFKAFLTYIKSLDYVSVSKEITSKYKNLENSESEIPKWQEDVVNKRLKDIDSGEMKTRSWDKAKKDIFKK
jgi:predicted nucleotide-binding protein (sugar kinase/HSP70/actin superfamily)